MASLDGDLGREANSQIFWADGKQLQYPLGELILCARTVFRAGDTVMNTTFPRTRRCRGPRCSGIPQATRRPCSPVLRPAPLARHKPPGVNTLPPPPRPCSANELVRARPEPPGPPPEGAPPLKVLSAGCGARAARAAAASPGLRPLPGHAARALAPAQRLPPTGPEAEPPGPPAPQPSHPARGVAGLRGSRAPLPHACPRLQSKRLPGPQAQ
ncbi:cuticle collagen 2C-like [Myotis yumanensis]|uniref:cuticle collagen 2C-like n=1 Tax=Myotis yumanensis TaxID=159337 RepID=UPI0038D01B4D